MRNLVVLIVSMSLLIAGCASVHSSNAERTPMEKPDLRIKNLGDVTQAALLDLTQHYDTSEVYIVVHPSYYVFFSKKSFDIEPTNTKNAVQCFVEDTPANDSSLLTLLRLYEHQEMDFIASASLSGKVVLMLIPGNYMKSPSKLLRDHTSDQYARYINDIAGDSDTVFYVQTKRFDTGKVDIDDLLIIVNFLKAINAENVYLAGGFIGRCQEEFHQSLARYWPEDKIALIPELSAISPDDITESVAKMLLTDDNRLNVWAANYFIRNGGLKSLQTKVNIKNITQTGNTNY